MSFDPYNANKFVVVIGDAGDSNIGKAIIGTISGASISFGALYNFSAGATGYVFGGFVPNTENKIACFYGDSTNSSFGTVVVGTISGTSISFGSEYVVFNNYHYFNLDFDTALGSAGKFVAICGLGTSSRGQAMLGQVASATAVSNMSSTDFIGLSTAAYADAETATVTLPAGLSTNQSGLVTGSEYYIQNDGTLSTSPDNPSVLVGKALSATSILLKAY